MHRAIAPAVPDPRPVPVRAWAGRARTHCAGYPGYGADGRHRAAAARTSSVVDHATDRDAAKTDAVIALFAADQARALAFAADRSEEHTSELQSLMRISYAVFCLKKKPKSKPAKS